jgi:hypothetical protein
MEIIDGDCESSEQQVNTLQGHNEMFLCYSR